MNEKEHVALRSVKAPNSMEPLTTSPRSVPSCHVFQSTRR